MNHAVKYNQSYTNEVSVTTLYSSSTFVSARHKAGVKIQIYGPESQVEQEKEDEEEQEGRNLFQQCCKNDATPLPQYNMYHTARWAPM